MIEINYEKYLGEDKKLLDEFYTFYKERSYTNMVKYELKEIQDQINTFTNINSQSCFCASSDIEDTSKIFFLIIDNIKKKELGL